MSGKRWSLTDLAMPPALLVRLLTGVLFTFSAIGFLQDIFQVGGLAGRGLLTLVLFSGGIATLWVFVFTRPRRQLLRLLPLLVAGQVAFMMIVKVHRRDPLHMSFDALRSRMQLDAIASGASLTLGYIFLMSFLRAIGERYTRVHTEMRLAHEIHALLVPTISQRIGQFEFFGVSSPSGEVGGDLIDLVEDDGRWTAYIADVSGHGVASGVLMGMVKSAARMKLAVPAPLDAFLSDLNRVILPLKTPNMFVTCACVQFDGSRRLSFSVAGHLPILRLTRHAPEIDELTVAQVPLGFFETQTFVASHVQFQTGDLFLLVTDGLTEVFDALGEEFGLRALKDAVRRAADKPLDELVAILLAKIRGHGKQLDDQTILAVRCLDSTM